ncbi:acyl carrier protein [Rhizobium sp. TRM95796]|uniref:acyl carrier protein n=1 Tax=Rhizobium sp. TRM95796 TaxID=2979862 RepID=UPI0021E80362|nr:acyl carrier protein [Rhizobium sp. TRM95796]MCV3765985.1 acyl carrier protein [Rhizobium sp. TRM95796]
MTNSMGLYGDGDESELLEDVEEAFGCRFNEFELEHVRTVGDFFNAVAAKLPAGAAEGRCATAMTFFRLRRALQPRIGTKLRPHTPITVLSSIPTREIHRIIEKDCHLRAPFLELPLLGYAALVLMIAAPITILVSGYSWWLAITSAVLACAVLKIAPIRLPSRIATFGDLARIVSSKNIRLLADEGARLREQEAWDALKEVLADHTSLLKQEITRQTLIIAPKHVRR